VPYIDDWTELHAFCEGDLQLIAWNQVRPFLRTWSLDRFELAAVPARHAAKVKYLCQSSARIAYLPLCGSLTTSRTRAGDAAISTAAGSTCTPMINNVANAVAETLSRVAQELPPARNATAKDISTYVLGLASNLAGCTIWG